MADEALTMPATILVEGYYVIVCRGNPPEKRALWVLVRRDNQGDSLPFFFTEEEADLVAERINADCEGVTAEVAEWFVADRVGLNDNIDEAVAAALPLPVRS